MADFVSLVNGWHFANPQELAKRIALAEQYATAHPISERQKRVLNEMKEAAEKQIFREKQ